MGCFGQSNMHRITRFLPSSAGKESNVQKQKKCLKSYCLIYILWSSFCCFYEHETIPQYSWDDVITTWRCILGFFFSLFGFWFCLLFTDSISFKEAFSTKISFHWWPNKYELPKIRELCQVFDRFWHQFFDNLLSIRYISQWVANF